jgi:cell division protein FtsQ
MPRVTRSPRNSVNDRPARRTLLLRKLRRFTRPAAWAAFVLVLLLIAGSALRTAEPGGMLASVRTRIAAATADLGLRVAHIQIEGRANTPEPLLRAAMGIDKGDPILGFSLDAVRRNVERLSWVEYATIERRLPDTVVVHLQERRPFAIWQSHGKFVLIDRNGQVVTNEDVASFRQLPLVVGPGAPEAAAPLIDALTDRPGLMARVVAAVRVGERRWNLVLKGGINVMLPEGHEVAALDRLMSLQQDHALLDRPLEVVDMRLPDRLVLRPRPDASTDSAASAKKPT